MSETLKINMQWISPFFLFNENQTTCRLTNSLFDLIKNEKFILKKQMKDVQTAKVHRYFVETIRNDNKRRVTNRSTWSKRVFHSNQPRKTDKNQLQ